MCLCCILYGCDWQRYVLCGPLHLYVPLWVEVVVPKNDLVVLAPSGQQGPVPHLTQSEHTAVMGLDLTADLVRTYRGNEQRGERREERGEMRDRERERERENERKKIAQKERRGREE